MRDWSRPVALFLTVVICVLALLPQTSGLSDFQSDFAGRPPAVAGGRPARLAESVYLIVIDGLRYDIAVSDDMPYLSGLRSRAAWGEMKTGLPSYSRPGYARIISGAPAELTGLTMNDQEASSPVPTVFSLAAAAGLRIAASAHHWFLELAENKLPDARTGLISGQNIQRGFYYRGNEPDTRVFANAREMIRTDRPDLLLIHPMSMDAAGHEHGGCSDAYRKAAAALDRILADFVQTLSQSVSRKNCLLIITADHGHRAAGGHGGGEEEAVTAPLFVIGPGVRPGRLPRIADQLDLAPTIAAALGLPMPGSMGGRVLAEAFAAESGWEEAQEILVKAQAEYLAANADLLGMKQGADPQAWREALARARAADDGTAGPYAGLWNKARRAYLCRRFFWRLPLALLMAAGMVLLWIRLLRREGWQWPTLAGLVYPLYFYALLRLLGADYSYSAIVTPQDYALRVSLAAVLALAVLTWAGAALRRGREGFFSATALGAWTSQAALSVAVWAAVGGGFRRFLPDPGWQVFLMVQLLVTAIVSAYALAGMGVLRLAGRQGRGPTDNAAA